jgi:hypothetical protein
LINILHHINKWQPHNHFNTCRKEFEKSILVHDKSFQGNKTISRYLPKRRELPDPDYPQITSSVVRKDSIFSILEQEQDRCLLSPFYSTLSYRF